MTLVHIIGAGLAGLSTAIRLLDAGMRVRLYEAAGHAGGRCRSFEDKHLGTLIDNGNHLIMSGNRSATSYLERIGARDTMIEPPRAVFPFIDLKTGERWTLRPNPGPLPYWLLDPARRVPKTRFADYGSGLNVAFAGPDKTVADVLDTDGPLYERFWEPLVLAALNTTADNGAARLLRIVLLETFAKGEAACRPLIAREGLGPSFVDPALDHLAKGGAEIRYAHRLAGLVRDGDRVRRLDFHHGPIDVADDDWVVLALPSTRAGQILPELDPPGDGGVIVNAHYRLDRTVEGSDTMPFLGLINSPVHWIFLRGDIVSLTISAAGALADEPAETLLPRLWRDTAQALDLGETSYRAARMIKERKATFDESPAGLAKRSGPGTASTNLALAGDWTDTGLPATIESAIRSGERACAHIRARA
ncbi:MAG: hydroxysqualene dehydroxylase HpnE [Alphaproteobacteria bacterium]